jgi:predicted DNA-binding transcriptional regulator AlpA
MESLDRQIDILAIDQSASLNGEKYMTDKELSGALRISRHTLWEYRNRGILPYYEIGGKILYKESDVEELMQRRYYESFKK